MRKLLILVLIASSAWCKAQNQRYDLHTDTLTYQYFLKGDWNRLIDSAQYAIKHNVDFKFLRQRLGYAYFIKGAYYNSEYHYEQALKFDPLDETTTTYLYYCGINTGNETYTRYRSAKLSATDKKSFGIKPVNAISMFDCEYNIKRNEYDERGNAGYYRIGVGTQLGYYINIYQAFSMYKQLNQSNYIDNSSSIPIQTTDSSSVNQAEYYITCNWNIAPHWQLNTSYHYVNTTLQTQSKYVYYIGTKKHSTLVDSTYHLPGHLFHCSLSHDWQRVNMGLSWSHFNYYNRITQQFGAHTGVVLPGKNYITLQTALYGMSNNKGMKKIIFSQSAGALILKALWLEASIKLGNLDYFAVNNGLYVYNSLDPTIFRSGLTSYLKINKRINIFGNYGFDKKLIEDNNIKYNQHSFSGGIIWKL